MNISASSREGTGDTGHAVWMDLMDEADSTWQTRQTEEQGES